MIQTVSIIKVYFELLNFFLHFVCSVNVKLFLMLLLENKQFNSKFNLSTPLLNLNRNSKVRTVSSLRTFSTVTGRFITRSVHYWKNGRFITGHWSFHYSVDSLLVFHYRLRCVIRHQYKDSFINTSPYPTPWTHSHKRCVIWHSCLRLMKLIYYPKILNFEFLSLGMPILYKEGWSIDAINV